MLKSIRSLSRIVRCRPSSLVQGSSPLRTRSMIGHTGLARRRQTPPRRRSHLSASPAPLLPASTDVRQSTTVPNVSNTSAFTDLSCGFDGPRPGLLRRRYARPPPNRRAIIAAAPACRNSRRECMASVLWIRREHGELGDEAAIVHLSAALTVCAMSSPRSLVGTPSASKLGRGRNWSRLRSD